MGLYRRNNSSNWQMCFFVNGKRVRMSTKTTSKKVAQRIYDKVKGQIAEGTFKLNSNQDMPFDQLVDEFLESHSKVETKCYQGDLRIGRVFKGYFGSRPISRITPYDIKSWRKHRADFITRRGTRIKIASLNRELAFLKAMFNMAVEWGWLQESPARKIRKLKGEVSRLRILTQEELTRLLNHADAYLKPIIITAVSTGMRKGEILNLKWQEVDFKNGFIRVSKSKNGKARDIPMSPYLSSMLRGLESSRLAGGYVFCHKSGERIRDIYTVFDRARRRAGLKDFRFHDLRHTAASLFAAGGCDIVTLQYILGHSSIMMTQRYAHLIPGRLQRTSQIMEEFWQDFGGGTKSTS